MRLVFALLVLVASHAAATACPAQAPQDPFGLFDAAVTVVEARVLTPPPPHRRAEPIELAVVAVYKGDPGLTRVMTRDDGTSCAPEFRQPGNAIYFLDANFEVIAGFQGYLEVKDTTWGNRLTAWGKAKTDDQRADVLVTAIEEIGNPAAARLLRRPELLVEIDAPRRAQLVAAVADDWQPAYTILVLARLRAPELLASVLDAKVWAYEKEVRAFLAVTQFTTETDPKKLAAAIRAPKSSDAVRAAALDRCEQLRGKSFESFLRYLHHPEDVIWKRLATACAN